MKVYYNTDQWLLVKVVVLSKILLNSSLWSHNKCKNKIIIAIELTKYSFCRPLTKKENQISKLKLLHFYMTLKLNL